MTRDDYRRAAGSFEPDASLKHRIASALEQPPRRSVRPLRRALVGTLAAVLALASLTGIAMAASPEIRQAVLRFFHIDEVERVPSGADAAWRRSPDRDGDRRPRHGVVYRHGLRRRVLPRESPAER